MTATGRGAPPDYFFGMNGRISRIPGVPAGRKVALFIDFDGTLVPIQQDPARCFLPDETKGLLESLANANHCYVAVLSGRSIKDIKAMVGIRTICYGGNHGLVISGGGMTYIHPGALSAKPLIDKAGRRLGKRIAGIRGAWVERKKFTVSLHYRLAGREAVPRLTGIFHDVAAEFRDEGPLAVMKGKKVLELMPDLAWNKGSAALRILRRLGGKYIPVFIGDDLTDETAFRALGRKGICIKIGKSGNTSAHYYLKTFREVPRLLQLILDSGLS